jgi:hypothetical protein
MASLHSKFLVRTVLNFSFTIIVELGLQGLQGMTDSVLSAGRDEKKNAIASSAGLCEERRSAAHWSRLAALYMQANLQSEIIAKSATCRVHGRSSACQ